jgi:hypothetical protein
VSTGQIGASRRRRPYWACHHDEPATCPLEPGSAWQRQRAGDPPPAPQRPQPPLREVLKGLDVRELGGETVFDPLVGLPSHGTR